MTHTDAASTLELMARLWPKAEWPKELQLEFARRLGRLPIDGEQARAALVNMRMGTKWTTVQPVELLDTLEGIIRRPSQSAQDGATPDEQEDVRLLIRTPELVHQLAREWLYAQGPRFGHWDPAWLLETGDRHKWAWGRRFVAWTKARLLEHHGSSDTEPSASSCHTATPLVEYEYGTTDQSHCGSSEGERTDSGSDRQGRGRGP